MFLLISRRGCPQPQELWPAVEWICVAVTGCNTALTKCPSQYHALLCMHVPLGSMRPKRQQSTRLTHPMTLSQQILERTWFCFWIN